jgi:uncharacterized membrane protein
MTDLFPQSVEKIVADYLDRLSSRLRGMPACDGREFIEEIRSHIYDSFMNESSGDEIERILTVLRKLGDPADVISSRMPRAITRIGKQRNAPLYLLASFLIALFGLPLGIGALALLIGLLAALFGLLVAYFATAVSLIVAGFVSAAASAIVLFAPGFLLTINRFAGQEVVQFGPFQNAPELAGVLGLIVSLILASVGLLMLWSGKHLWRGLRFVVNLVVVNIVDIFRRAGSSRQMQQARDHLGHATNADGALKP